MACTLVKGAGAHILLMGDSNAEMMATPFEELARAEGLTFSVAIRAGCPWQRDMFHLTAAIRDACRRSKAAWYDTIIPELDPDLIVVMNVELTRGPDAVTYAETSYNSKLRASTLDSIHTLTEGGRPLLIVESIPLADQTFNPLDCLRTSQSVEPCRFATSAVPNWLDTLERQAAMDDPLVWTLDIDALACPYLPICDPIIDGVVTYWNNAHLTARYALSLVPALSDALRDLGVDAFANAGQAP